MEKEMLESYNKIKDNLKSRLNQFKSLKEEEYYKEFMFCLLTPQSNAQRCWKAVEELSALQSLNHDSVLEILSKRTRFHHTKTSRVLKAKETFNKIFPLLSNTNRLELRNQIVKEVNGYGLKEAGHFLRNIGKSDNQIAILDRHILRNLKEKNVIESDKIKSANHYLEVEQAFLNYAKSIGIPPDELDLLWWSKENGEIFK